MKVDGFEFRNLRLENKREDERNLFGECPDITDKVYFRCEFYYNNVPRCTTILEASNKMVHSLQQYPVTLSRGLYEVALQRIDTSGKGNELTGEKEWYPDLLMAGDPYEVSIHIEEKTMYGEAGCLVTVESAEVELIPEDLYYKVLKSGELYKTLKYFVPIKNERETSFFVEGVTPGEITFPEYQNPALKLNISIG